MHCKIRSYLDMRLSPEVVNFCRLGFIDDLDKAVAINEVSIVEDHLALSVGLGVIIQMGDPASVERRRPSDDAMDSVTLVQQEFSQIGSILT